MPAVQPAKQGQVATRAISFDAMGTLVELEAPWVRLGAALEIPVDARLVNATKAEMAYYRDHCHEGRDQASLAALRARCAEVLSSALGRPVDPQTLMSSIRFRAFPDAEPALKGLRKRDLRLVCVSNWDISLPAVLERCGLDDLLDGVVTSAAAGARKPDPAIFAAGLELAGCGPDEALHVGDTPEEDVAGARGAGIRALLLDREGGGDIASLEEIEERIAS